MGTARAMELNEKEVVHRATLGKDPEFYPEEVLEEVVDNEVESVRLKSMVTNLGISGNGRNGSLDTIPLVPHIQS